jgi:hypothetical protein
MASNTARPMMAPRLNGAQNLAGQPMKVGILGRLFGRRPQPTTFQRCLAVHIHFAKPQRGSYT